MQHIIGEYSILVKMDVSDLDVSARWYEDKLGLIPENDFNTAHWRQFKFDDISKVSIGLHLNPQNIGSGGEALTILVEDVQAARRQLLEAGLEVGSVEQVGKGVQLAFFHDPDDNQLVLRQQQ